MIVHNGQKLTRFDLGLSEDEYNDLLIDLSIIVKDIVSKYDPNKKPPIYKKATPSACGKPVTITIKKEDYT